MTNFISIAVDVFFVYLLIGLLFSAWFALAGARKLDNGVSGTPWHFKLIIIPGAVLLWIILLLKLIRKR
ncbi:MAG: hypothetical protein AAGF85_10200 [Bacteroidota bacterium]